MRILHLLAPAPFGGLEAVVGALVVAQAQAGHDVEVGAIVDAGADEPSVIAALRQGGIVVHVLVTPNRRYLAERRMVRDVLRSRRPDVVHTHGYRADVLHGSVVRGLGIPVVTTVHGFTGTDWKNRFYEAMQRRMLRRFDAVVAVSRPMRDWLRHAGVPAARLHCIPNAWSDADDFLPRAQAREALGIAPDTQCIGFIGRLSEEKGPDIFLDALARMPRDVHAVVIGDGPLKTQLIARARHTAGDRIKWAGMIENARRLITAFDVLALSSRTEGTPVVLLEAMAAAVPIVATRVGGIPDLIGPSDGLLVPPADPDALAVMLTNALTDTDSARRRAANAERRLRAEFSRDRWLRDYDLVYNACARATHTN